MFRPPPLIYIVTCPLLLTIIDFWLSRDGKREEVGMLGGTRKGVGEWAGWRCWEVQGRG